VRHSLRGANGVPNTDQLILMQFNVLRSFFIPLHSVGVVYAESAMDETFLVNGNGQQRRDELPSREQQRNTETVRRQIRHKGWHAEVQIAVRMCDNVTDFQLVASSSTKIINTKKEIGKLIIICNINVDGRSPATPSQIFYRLLPSGAIIIKYEAGGYEQLKNHSDRL